MEDFETLHENTLKCGTTLWFKCGMDSTFEEVEKSFDAFEINLLALLEFFRNFALCGEYKDPTKVLKRITECYESINTHGKLYDTKLLQTWLNKFAMFIAEFNCTRDPASIQC